MSLARFWSRLRHERVTLACSLALLGIVLVVLLADVLPLADPNATQLEQRLRAPLAGGHWLGTDQLGRDLLSRLAYGTRLSLAVALLGVVVAACTGALIGLTAGYYAGRVDGLLMRAIDILMAFPYLLLALAIVAVLGPGLGNATIAIAIVNVPFFARSVRGQTLLIRRAAFVDAARVSGLTDVRILWSEILPSLVPTLIVSATTSAGWMVLETAGLSFLGLGAQPPTADLGGMLGQGRYLLATAPHVCLVPGVVIFLIVGLLNLLGDGLGDVLDPRRPMGAARAAPARPQPLTALAQPPDASPVAGQLLNVANLSVSLGERALVDGVSFGLGRGERLGLVGESGSGKSLTALALLALCPPELRVEGTIQFGGRELTRLGPRALAELRGGSIAWIPQDPMTSLHPLLSVRRQLTEVLALHRGLRGSQARAESIRLLRQVGIADPEARLSAWPHELSGGMRQRVVIAMALAGEPEIVIADEPTTALDVTTQAAVIDRLEHLCDERGVGLLFISHDLSVVSQLCENVLVMRRGRIVEAQSADRLLRDPEHPYTRELLAAVPRLGEPERLLKPSEGPP